MVRPVKGDVVVTLFPFSDLSSSKRRPALVVARLTGDDVVLCQITSRAKFDRYAITLDPEDFSSGAGGRQADRHRGIVSNGDGSATLTLSDGTSVRVSRRRSAEVRRALEK